jgi:Domain of unknown function (DUF4352)
VTRRRRRLAIRVSELVAVLATAGAVLILLSGGGTNRPEPGARSASLGARTAPTPAPHKPTRHRSRRRAVKTPVGPQPNCDAKGITLEGGRQGTCIDDAGHRITVVNRDSTLRLDEMNANIDHIGVRRTVGKGVYRVAAEGLFVMVTVTIHNKLRGPALFRPDEMSLVLGPSTYYNDAAAEASDPKSFANRGGFIRKGHSVTGRVIFDVPETAAPSLDIDGNVVIVQFRDYDYTSAINTVGYFRTYR